MRRSSPTVRSMNQTGTAATGLIVLRGNSGSGKSTTAWALRERLGRRLALVEQDYVRRIVLKARDTADGPHYGLIEQTVRYALDAGYDVVLEGILHRGRYHDLLSPRKRLVVTGAATTTAVIVTHALTARSWCAHARGLALSVPRSRSCCHATAAALRRPRPAAGVRRACDTARSFAAAPRSGPPPLERSTVDRRRW